MHDLELIPILHERQAERFRDGLPPSSSPLESLMRRFFLSPTPGWLHKGFRLGMEWTP
ncbi:hypothetical protein BN874_130049 [Candidatus Contendobacter odensis Run_B_J11]|uniref:Uncharacterized protein n=1 Tax=Candidatus Contendobacter odensis Run_B_J11 TaxID=1400861 RepID=A0A7U7G8V6_9GAMM|nr:hypothetical protein BN874_130049 [Candidatus Contendobacter odensis Run_B_J11]